jgi:RimJ/RimL family protein N-acetyltransferase
MISSSLIITRCGSVIETELEQYEVQPPTELGTDLGHTGHLDETESLVEPNRRLVRTIDSANHRVGRVNWDGRVSSSHGAIRLPTTQLSRHRVRMRHSEAPRIRGLEPADVGDAVRMFDDVAEESLWVGTEGGFDIAEREARIAESLANPMKHRSVIAQDQDSGAIVGMASAALAAYGVADIGMSVIRSWRGRGLGGRLLDAILDEVRDLGAHKVSLQVFPHNARAIGLYRTRGFGAEGRLVRHYRRRNGEVWDAIIMGLELDPTAPGSPHSDESLVS